MAAIIEVMDFHSQIMIGLQLLPIAQWINSRDQNWEPPPPYAITSGGISYMASGWLGKITFIKEEELYSHWKMHTLGTDLPSLCLLKLPSILIYRMSSLLSWYSIQHCSWPWNSPYREQSVPIKSFWWDSLVASCTQIPWTSWFSREIKCLLKTELQT